MALAAAQCLRSRVSCLLSFTRWSAVRGLSSVVITMHPAILSTSGPLVFVPVRHHSPACARAVLVLVRELRPAAVLIEGPSDFNERLDELYLPHTLPIAIYSYVRLGDDLRRGAFYPFC